MDPMQRAMMRADPALSRYSPLSRILAYDDFSHGMAGWTALTGNYEDTLDNVLPAFRGMYAPQLSAATHWDTGTHGALSGTYSLKIATLPEKGALNLILKRMTFQQPGPIQVEMYFAAKPEANELRLGDRDFGAFGILFDLQDPQHTRAAGRRSMPHLKYLNARDGDLRQVWQYKSHVETDRHVGPSGETRSHPHFSADGWKDIPGGEQILCYNELPTKLNWHYLRVGVDLVTMRVTALQCNDRHFDVGPIETMEMPAWPNLWNMLNVCLFCETASDKRSFFYVDSILVSGEWGDA
jgi:hypothetical protein